MLIPADPATPAGAGADTPPPAGPDPLNHPSVVRFKHVLRDLGHPDTVVVLPASAHTAVEAAAALDAPVEAIASSLIFGLPSAAGVDPLLVVTSGAHRVDTAKVAADLGVAALTRVDAAFVRAVSGYAIGGVAPIGWQSSDAEGWHQPPTLLDSWLAEQPRLWAAAGHPRCVFATTWPQLTALTGGRVVDVA